MPIAAVSEKEEYVTSILPKERVAKAKRFVRDSDRALSLAAGYLIAKYVGESYVDIYGKPRSTTLYFSVAHSGDVAALALSPACEVGLDIEKEFEKRGSDDPAEYCLSEEEQQSYRDGTPFLSLFTAKESLAKAEGKGLISGIKDIPSLPMDGKVKYKEKVYHRHSLIKDGYFLSVTAEGEDFIIETEATYVE